MPDSTVPFASAKTLARATSLVWVVSLLVGCFPGGESAIYTRTWHQPHLLLADRNEERTHYVAFETSPPGFHYSADARSAPATALVFHTPSESVPAFSITPAHLERWKNEYFDPSQCTHTIDADRDSEGYFLRHSSGPGVARFLSCFFRKSDGQLKSIEYRVDPGSVDLDGTFDKGPFSFSLGSGVRIALPIRVGDARAFLEGGRGRE